MQDDAPCPHPLRVADLPDRGGTDFLLEPDAGVRSVIAGRLSLSGLRKLRFGGTLSPLGKTGWRLEAALGATVVQPCVVTLKPVTTRLEVSVARRYLAGIASVASGRESEMPDDDDAEPLGEFIDTGEVMFEALALCLPDYPRAGNATPGDAVFCRTPAPRQ